MATESDRPAATTKACEELLKLQPMKNEGRLFAQQARGSAEAKEMTEELAGCGMRQPVQATHH